MRVIYVDSEKTALEDFKEKVGNFREIRQLRLFSNGQEALNWVMSHPIDVAFLETEIADMSGLELAKRFKELDNNIRLFFITAQEQYALDAFRVKALGYMLKPCTTEEVKDALELAALVRNRPEKRVVIQTIPNFAIWVDGERLSLNGAKKAELLALLVDHGATGITCGEAIACLWPGRPADEKTQTLYRVTFHQLLDELKQAGVDHIIGVEGKRKFLKTEQVNCDLYRILNGETMDIISYGGDYLKEYSWAETRNAQLVSIQSNYKR